MQTIGITGGTGFVGHHLTQKLMEQGHRVIIFTRDMHKVSRQENVTYSFWSPTEKKFDLRFFKELDAVIHLAGAGVADKRWTAKRKDEIVSSRVQGTEFLIDRLREHAPKCRTMIGASAIGYYGPDRPHEIPFAEEAKPGSDFLARTCQLWEAATHKADELMRTVILRFGIVLGRDDGAFPQFARPQDFGIIPILGSGRQMISWIHIEDLCAMILWVLQQENIEGVYNAVAPSPVSQKELCKAIASCKKGIKLPVHVPDVILKIALGGLSSEALKSATVSAEKIRQQGFSFRYTDIREAVSDILQG